MSASSEFASLVEQLILNPDNPVLKLALIKQLPYMKALAELNPLSLFRLAQLYIPSSAQYKTMMMESAERGCTNAMLAVCELLLKSGGKEQLNLVTKYVQNIEASNDSFILAKAKKLVADYPQYNAELNTGANITTGLKSMGFFKVATNKTPDDGLLPAINTGLAPS